MKYNVKIYKLIDSNLVKYLNSSNSNSFSSTLIDGLKKVKYYTFNIVVFKYIISFRKQIVIQ